MNDILKKVYVALALKRYSVAEELCRQLLLTNPNDVLALAALADSYAYRREYDKALETAKQARELAPTNLYVLNVIARCLLNTKKQSEAVAILEQCVQIDPDHAFSHALLSMAFSSTAPEKAEYHAIRAVDLDSDDVPGLTNVVYALQEAGRLKYADQVLSRLGEIAPNDPLVLVLLSERAARSGDLNVALQDARKAAQQAPNSRETLFQLCVAEFSAGNTERGEQVWSDYLRLSPTPLTFGQRFAGKGLIRVMGLINKFQSKIAKARTK